MRTLRKEVLYVLLFSDFDGTLRQNNEETVSEENLEAIRKWRAAGNIFVIVTGRHHSVINKKLPGWEKLVDYLIMDNGGAIFSNADTLIHYYKFERGIIRTIRSTTHNYAKTFVYSPERISIELMLGEIPIKLRLYCKTEERYARCKNRIEDLNLPIKVIAWPKPGFSKLPNGENPEDYPFVLDIVSGRSGKAQAIEWLIEREFPNEKIISIGDDDNDVDMLSKYHGYAIEGVPDNIITAAGGRTAKSVAELIYQHI